MTIYTSPGAGLGKDPCRKKTQGHLGCPPLTKQDEPSSSMTTVLIGPEQEDLGLVLALRAPPV